ncbi:hypothetical protein [[Clostridium] fimetarium]|uniref:Uncharacterized protein n=1 Tax=[Clostridium] fimetarium TaxID=99656 RepID=A0A1I0MYX4_9FIRM|nr:hypothetical protein [[Clostridium] fimetarium]SEV93686.1 hypothetical protein SAMN05421659_102243 [[Clostridium] fimetarium]
MCPIARKMPKTMEKDFITTKRQELKIKNEYDIEKQVYIAAINRAAINKKRCDNTNSILGRLVRLDDDMPYTAIITDIFETTDKIHVIYSVFNISGQSRDIDQGYAYSGFQYEQLCQISNLLLRENEPIFELIGKSCIVMLKHKGQYLNLHVLEAVEGLEELENQDFDEENDDDQ